MKEDLFAFAQEKVRDSGLTLMAAECSIDMGGSWYLIVATEPLRRLFWDRQSGWLVVEEEVCGVLNGPRVWKDIWISENMDRKCLEKAVIRLAKGQVNP